MSARLPNLGEVGRHQELETTIQEAKGPCYACSMPFCLLSNEEAQL